MCMVAVKALNQARLEANVRVTGEINFKNKWPSPFAVVSGLLLLLSFFKYVYSPFRWLAVAAAVAGIYPILAKSVASIARTRIDINVLVVITGNISVSFFFYFSTLNHTDRIRFLYIFIKNILKLY